MKPKKDGAINEPQWKVPDMALFAIDAGNAAVQRHASFLIR